MYKQAKGKSFILHVGGVKPFCTNAGSIFDIYKHTSFCLAAFVNQEVYVSYIICDNFIENSHSSVPCSERKASRSYVQSTGYVC